MRENRAGRPDPCVTLASPPFKLFRLTERRHYVVALQGLALFSPKVALSRREGGACTRDGRVILATGSRSDIHCLRPAQGSRFWHRAHRY